MHLPNALSGTYHYFFGKKNNETGTRQKIGYETLQQKIVNFNNSWNDLIAADQKLGGAAAISLLFVKDILSSLPILAVCLAGGVYIYRQVHRSEKFKEFQNRRDELYKVYLDRIQPRFILNEETIAILEAIAPVISDADSLIPTNFTSVLTGSNSIHNDVRTKKLFTQWCEILSRSPHNRQFTFIMENSTISYGICKPESLQNKVKQEVIHELYANDLKKRVDDETIPVRIRKLL